MRSVWAVFFWYALNLWIPSVTLGEDRCPGEITPIAYRSLEHSQIGLPVMINGQGPYLFMLDTGAQITILDTALATDLDLVPQSTIGILSVARYSEAGLVNVHSIEIGRYSVQELHVASQSLDRIRAINPRVQGILGEDFLARFDLLINNSRKYLCLDETRRMQQAILGQRVSFLRAMGIDQDAHFAQPVLVSVHIPGDDRQGTVVRLDSGSSAPVLFSSRGQILPWLQRTSASRGSVSGTAKDIQFAMLPAQSVRIGDHLERRIAFLTPISSGTPYTKAGEGGLLPTALFKEILISFPDRFVVFDPRDACSAAEAQEEGN